MSAIKLYMAVTADRYELPIAVEETPTELSAKTGISLNSIMTALYRPINGKKIGMKFYRLQVDDED